MIGPARLALRGGIATVNASSIQQQMPELYRRSEDEPPTEIEIGFGKGRYLLNRAEQEPEVRFIGLEMVSFYFKMVARRASRRGLDNVALLHCEALYALSALLPCGFADVVHVYHPDPWPKARHHKRRLFDTESLDLLLSALKPGGELLFGSDHLAYADLVEEILRAHPGLEVQSLAEWPGGPRTHYEQRFVERGQPIRRLCARWTSREALHPQGKLGLTSAWTSPVDHTERIGANGGEGREAGGESLG